MADIEKVIKGLEMIIGEVEHNSMWFPFEDEVKDAIALLKEQPQIVRCKDCKYHGNINEDYCTCLEQETNYDFFCWYGQCR